MWPKPNKVVKCEMCKKEFRITSVTQRFCGSSRQRTGCSFIRRRDKQGLKVRFTKSKPKSDFYNLSFVAEQYHKPKVKIKPLELMYYL